MDIELKNISQNYVSSERNWTGVIQVMEEVSKAENYL